MSDKAQKTILIKWVRSGIGFTFRQEDIVRSLGLKKLNHVVERPDTPQIRGVVAKVPHLLRIVPAVLKPAWLSVPEYTVYPRPLAQAKVPSETFTPEVREGETGETKSAVAAVAKAPAVKAAKKPKTATAKKPATAKASAAASAKTGAKTSKKSSATKGKQKA